MVMEEREASSFYGYGERGERSFKLLGLWRKRALLLSEEKWAWPRASLSLLKREKKSSLYRNS